MLKNNLTAIYCCGETLEEREAGRAEEVVKHQLSFLPESFNRSGSGLLSSAMSLTPSATKEGGLLAATSHELLATSHYLIAYEPVWAIGTGLTPTSGQIAAMHQFIKAEVKDSKVLYGGSVKPENIKEILATDDVDGVLVGGASVDPEAWGKIVR